VGEDDGSVDEWLDILVQREIVFPRQAADAREYVFRHALVRDAAYEMLTAQDCRLGHRLAGEYLEQAGERAAIVLVEHYERAAWLACLLRAAGYLLPAGRYDLTQELLDEVEVQQRALEPLRRVRLENLKAQIALHHGQQARALAGFEAALKACEPLGDARAS